VYRRPSIEKEHTQMETWDAICSRRNVRSFTDEPLEPGQLDRILEAARRTPSSRNWQPWDFVVVTERERLRQLAQVWVGARHVAFSAATIALIGPLTDEPREHELVQYDLGQATMSIMIAAADLGIGTGHSAVADQDLARRLLGFPEDRFCAYLIALGHPSDRPLAPLRRINRRPFDEVVHRERW
jgi:nitroreductase